MTYLSSFKDSFQLLVATKYAEVVVRILLTRFNDGRSRRVELIIVGGGVLVANRIIAFQNGSSLQKKIPVQRLCVQRSILILPTSNNGKTSRKIRLSKHYSEAWNERDYWRESDKEGKREKKIIICATSDVVRG